MFTVRHSTIICIGSLFIANKHGSQTGVLAQKEKLTHRKIRTATWVTCQLYANCMPTVKHSHPCTNNAGQPAWRSTYWGHTVGLTLYIESVA